MPTYKITNPEAVEAQKNFDAAVEHVQTAGKEFAARYPGSRPVFGYTHDGIIVAGLAFPNGNDSPLWTRPQRDGGGRQTPRMAPAKGVKGQERRQQVADLVPLNKEWSAHYPKQKADRDPVYTACGTDWGSVLICGFSHFGFGDSVYINTSMTPHESWQEILGSEYDAAKAAHQAALKAVTA